MSLQIVQRDREGIAILDLDGPLVLGEQASDLRQKLLDLRESGHAKIALNMQNVSRIDSTGLGTLAFALVRLRNVGGGLLLFNLRPSHMDLLLLTKLVTVFELFPDEQSAVNRCFPDRETQHYDILHFVQHDV